MLAYKNINDHIVPISRFNKGESNKIFEEVARNGLSVVMKNNHAECILLSPAMYDVMLDALEDSYWTAVIKERENAGSENLSTMQAVAGRYGITEEELQGVPDVEIE